MFSTLFTVSKYKQWSQNLQQQLYLYSKQIEMFLQSFCVQKCFKIVQPLVKHQQNRTATVLKRVNRPPILTKGKDVSGRITQEDIDANAIPTFLDGPSNEFLQDPWYLRYEVLEEDSDAEIPHVKVILMKSMEDFGKRGQVSMCFHQELTEQFNKIPSLGNDQ